MRNIGAARRLAILACALVLGCGGPSPRADAQRPSLWFFLWTDLGDEKRVQWAEELVQRAGKAGYEGLMLYDSGFWSLDRLPAGYVQNVGKVRESCRRANLRCVLSVCPFGYSNDLLVRDPNLAEGVPVVDAPFVVRDGKLVPEIIEARIANRGFEDHQDGTPASWQAEGYGRRLAVDTDAACEGTASLRMTAAADPNTASSFSAVQALKVRPHTYYHLSVALKTEDLVAGPVRVEAQGPDIFPLNFDSPVVKPTQDWTRIDVTFNSLGFEKVNLIFGFWGAKDGTAWWDDARLESAGLVNVVRRPGAPLRVTSLDGKTLYEEGKDFDGARDPKLGMHPWPGGFSAWHQPSVPTVPAGSRLKEGQRVILSYYHAALIWSDKVMCCLGEPAVFDILKRQVAQMHRDLRPDGYFMQHDEIRVGGWDASCQALGDTSARILAENVRRCRSIIRKADPNKPLYVWSDVFDPYHNALQKGRYFLVKGDGPWYGAGEGLNRDVTVVNWHMQADGRREALYHFDRLGYSQILAGFYDTDLKETADWLKDAAQVRNVVGMMYTTWRGDFSKLEDFARCASALPRYRKAREVVLDMEANKQLAAAMSAPDLNTNDWPETELPQQWEKVLGQFDGLVWFRKEVDIPQAWDGKDLLVRLGPVDEIDVTWFNGVRIGVTGSLRDDDFVKYWDVPRRYEVPGAIVKAGRAVVTVRVIDTQYVGGLWGSAPQDMRIEPARQPASVTVPLSGKWRYRVGADLYGGDVPSATTPGTSAGDRKPGVVEGPRDLRERLLPLVSDERSPSIRSLGHLIDRVQKNNG
jgi:hypothetical protein